MFEEDQGINLDDEDAKEVEQGEFCRPPTIIKRGGMGKPGQLQKVMDGSAGVKRSNTVESGSASPANGKKKKVKKV